MEVDRWLGILGLVTGLLGIYFAYYFYRKSIRTKVLAIAYSNPVPLMFPVPDVTVSYKETVQTALSRVFILLWNKGTAPIEVTDFLGPIKFRGDTSLFLNIYDKDPTAKVALSEDKVLSIELLRPGESIIVQADAGQEDFKPDIAVEMKSADMSIFIQGYRALWPQATAFLGAGVTFIFLFILYPLMDYIPKGVSEIVFFVLLMFSMLSTFFVCVLVGAICAAFVKKIIQTRTPVVAWRFFEIQYSAMSVLERWKTLKKNIEEISRK